VYLLRVLISGFHPNSWSVERSWVIDDRPLSDADALHEYDLIVLKPSLFGGILPNYKNALKHNEWVKWEYGEQFTETIRQRRMELLLASIQGRLAIFPCSETSLRYQVPKALPFTVRNLNEAIGRGFENYDEKRVSNLDLLSFWGIGFRSGAGESVKMVCPGHPTNEYLQLAKLRWDTSFILEERISHTLLATDRDGVRTIGAEVDVRGCRLLLLPESQHEDALKTLVSGMERVRTWHDQTMVRSSDERKLIGDLNEIRSKMSELMIAASVKAEELYKAETLVERARLKDPVLEAAYKDYKQACVERDIGVLYRAYERLKKIQGGENNLREFLKWNEKDSQEWGRLRNSITQVANRSDRHPERNNPAAPPNVSDQEFDNAVQAMKTFLEKYVDVIAEGE
jgi:hypothetical protein